MSLAIEVDNVTGVFLRDGWHKVRDESFEIDAYEFHHRRDIRVGCGEVQGVSAWGATWKEPNGS